MAKVSCKQLLLVSLIVLCFLSASCRARKLLEEAKTENQVVKDQEHQEQQKQSLKANEKGEADVSEELTADIDYTPARKKPPIHNN